MGKTGKGMNGEERFPNDIEELVRGRDRRKAEFVATVSHDLKTPLNAIIGFTSVLLQDAGRMDPEPARQLHLVYDSARQLLGRINDLLEFHRMESGKISCAPSWCSVQELLLQAMEPFREPAAKQGVQLFVEAGSVPQRLRSDSGLILRVLREFLSNALKFDHRGPVKLAGALDLSGGRASVRLWVTDHGIGLAPKVLTTLTRSLKPSRSVAERSYEGLGLGLALCREAAELLGGNIAVEGQPDSGCTFSLLLNLASDDVG